MKIIITALQIAINNYSNNKCNRIDKYVSYYTVTAHNILILPFKDC